MDVPPSQRQELAKPKSGERGDDEQRRVLFVRPFSLGHLVRGDGGSTGIPVQSVARSTGESEHFLWLVEVDRLRVGLAPLVRGASRVAGQSEGVLAHRVGEHAAEHLAMLVDRSRAHARGRVEGREEATHLG